MQYLGDFAEDSTVYIPFNTFSSDDPQASVTITNLADADIMVHKDGGTTQIATDGATVAINFDTITGNHLITIDTSVHADYSTGSDYLVRIEGTTIDGGTINAWIGSFSIENRFMRGTDSAYTGTPPTAAAIVNEWETQSQADPTGFHVNVKEVNDTSQTANDNGADINTLLTRIVGTLAAGTHNPASAAQIAVLSDWINNGRLDLILDIIAADVVNLDGAAMRGTDNAATETKQDIIDAIVDGIKSKTDSLTFTVANEVDSNVITKTGFSLLATGLDLILFDSIFLLASAKANWTDNLTSYTNGMAGKRLKGLSAATVVEGTVNDASATTLSFISDLTGYGINFFVDTEIAVEISVDQWQPRIITAYNTITGEMTVDEAFISAPANTSKIALTMRHVHSISSINAEIDTALSDIGLDHLISTSVAGADITDDSIIAYLVSSAATADWDTYVNTTDSMQGARDAIYGNTNNIRDDTEDLQAQIGTAGAGLTDLGGMSTGMKAEILAEVVKVLITQMTESYAADNTAPTMTQALMLIQQALTEFDITSTTKTIKRLDGSTTAAIETLDDDTNPTSITRTT